MSGGRIGGALDVCCRIWTMVDYMCPDHKWWSEFILRLEGPDGCDFREDATVKGGTTWECGGGTDKTRSEKILRDMGFDDGGVFASLYYFEQHGGACDCEVIFNIN